MGLSRQENIMTWFSSGAGSPDGLRLCPTAGAVIETVRLQWNQCNAPSGQVLIERRRICEHSVHVGDAGGVPAADILVE